MPSEEPQSFPLLDISLSAAEQAVLWWWECCLFPTAPRGFSCACLPQVVLAFLLLLCKEECIKTSKREEKKEGGGEERFMFHWQWFSKDP